MKKILFILVALCGLTACTSGPKSVATNLLTAIANGNKEEAKSYCTEDTGKLLDFIFSLDGDKKDSNFKIEAMRDSIVDNVAYVMFTESGKTKEETLTLYKIDGEWKVGIEPKK